MTMNQAIKLHNKSGKHFFDKDTMDFFNSEVESELFDDHYFITSERMELDMPKQYTVWKFNDDYSDVSEAIESKTYATLDDAMEALAIIRKES